MSWVQILPDVPNHKGESMKHEQESALAGQTVMIESGQFEGQEYIVEDWWDRVTGKSWMICKGNPACLDYAARSAIEKMPIDDNVLYGKIGMFGKLIHVSQIESA